MENSYKTIIAYHGTNSKSFTYFNPIKKGKRGLTFGDGFYFSINRKTASTYGKNIIKVKLTLKNPFNLDNPSKKDWNNIAKVINQNRQKRGKPDIDLSNYEIDFFKLKTGEQRGFFIQDFLGNITNLITQAGYDSIILNNYDEIVVFNIQNINILSENTIQRILLLDKGVV